MGKKKKAKKDDTVTFTYAKTEDRWPLTEYGRIIGHVTTRTEPGARKWLEDILNDTLQDMLRASRLYGFDPSLARIVVADPDQLHRFYSYGWYAEVKR